MATSAEADLAAKLLERLLGDPAFRARFRRDPAGACREAGLESLAQEMSVGGGKAMHTLDIRESKSSLAGVMMAAAMEGVAIYQFTENVLPHLEEIPGQIADVLSRIDLPAIPDVLKKPGSGGDAIPTAVEPPPGEGGELGGAADAGVSAGGGGGAAAAVTPPAAAVQPPAAPAAAEAATGKDAGGGAAADAAGGGAKDAAGDGGGKDAAADGGAEKDAGNDAAQEAAKKIAEENSPEAAEKQIQEQAAGDLDQRTTGTPSSSDLPTGDTTLPGDAPPADAAAAPAAGAAPPAAPPEAAGAAPPAEGAPADTALPTGSAAPDTTLPSAPPESDTTLPTEPAENLEATDPVKPRRPRAAAVADAVSTPKKRAPIDPSQFGGEGKGGPPDPEALALLKNKNVVLDADGIKDIKAGRIDPRVVAVLTKLSSEHKITVTCMCSDHDKFTAGGSVSNHHFGRGMDIGAIDGEIVGPGSPLAREVASELSTLNADYRPNEIGSPFAIAGPGYFTDAAHQNHLHIGFKQAITPDWKPPADVAADGAPAAAASAAAVTPAAAPAAVAAAPVAPAAAIPVAPAPVAAAAVAAEPPPKLASDSQMFLKAVTAKAADADRKDVAANESLAFLKAVEPPKASAAAATPAGTPVAAAADAAAVAAAAPDAYPGDNAPREQIAAWMAGQASKRGLPPELPLMASLVESGMKNLNFGDADSVGFFQMRLSIWNSGPYAGYPDKPELQVKWFLDEAEKVKAQRVAAGKSITDPNQFGEWIADTERPAEQFRGRYQTKLAEAQSLLEARSPAVQAAPAAQAVVDAGAVAPAGGGGSSIGAAALGVAQTQSGVRETGGANRGPQVEQYLASADVAPGNPWCAAFVKWSLEQAGRKMPGGGWAAVSTWVRNAEQGNNGLKIVSAEEARPGDIVAYDFGGQDDFGGDGHIGFLASDVKGGQFTALEGNNADAVNTVPRRLGGAKIVFIRAEGNASGSAAPLPQSNAAAQLADQAPASAAPSKPIDPSQFGGEGTGTGGPPSAESLALLSNKNVVLDSVGVADIKAGRIDPRVVAVLTKLSSEHKITVTCMCSDHSKFTSGGSVSNHFFGRGMDIGAIDGEIVGPGSPLAREVASELSTLNPDYRPNEIGSPFAIAGPGYFTDAAHQNHLHIGFKEAITPEWKPPADVAAGAAPVASAAAAVPGAPAAAAAAPPPELKKESQLFLKAVTAQAAEADRKKVAGSGSMAFLKAVDPPQASAADAAQPAPVASAAAAAAAAVAAAAPDAYPGDSAPREQIAAWMAGQAEKRGLPPQLPLMASLVESGMKNLNFGDADSVGFFQMRLAFWNQGAYAGYPDKPELQVKWFLDQAEAVKRQRLVAGKSVTDPNQFGEWIADVERPAEQYRGRYQLKLDEANGLLNAAPAQPAAAPVAAPALDPAAAAAGAAALGDAKLPAEILAPVQEAMAAGNAPGPKALAAIQEASKYIGTDYKWGGSTPQTGFDCSGLMQWSYAQSGIQIPRVTYTQIEAPNGTEIADRANLKPGDLVFFSNQGDVHHVGMFLGGDKFLHAPSTGDVVKVSSLSEPYYAGQFAGGRRFDGGAPVAAVSSAAPAVASAAAAPAPAAAAGIDPTEVAKAQAAVARDAAEVRRNESQLFQAVKASEAAKDREKRRSMMFLKAIDPSQVKRPEAPAPEAAAAAAPVEPATPAPIPEPAPETPAPAVADPAPAAAAPNEAVAAASIDLTNAATDYPGDDASQAELAKWLAKQAEKSGLPPELPVMAALVESGVKNLNFGDADSVGFFQMRLGFWNNGAYAGYPDKPELQAKWFIDQALAVKRKAIASGDADFGKDPAKFGEWIANVERPAEQFRGRYQLRLGEARKLLS